MKELAARKHPRLTGYDYSQSGAYFITFCVKDRHELLGKVVGRDAPGAPITQNLPSMHLSEYGVVIYKEIAETPLHYNNVSIDNFVVMPNHVHMIISIQDEDSAPGASRPTTAMIPRIVAIIKRKTNKEYGFHMWQSSYHDRIIRDVAEYQRIWKYINENPLRWDEDTYNQNGAPGASL